MLDKVRVITLEVSYGLWEGEGSFGEIFDMLRNKFSFKGFIDPLVFGQKGDSLYQDALFVRRD